MECPFFPSSFSSTFFFPLSLISRGLDMTLFQSVSYQSTFSLMRVRILPLEKFQSCLEPFITHAGPPSPSISDLQNAELLPYPEPLFCSCKDSMPCHAIHRAQLGLALSMSRRPWWGKKHLCWVLCSAEHLPTSICICRWIA